MKYLVFGVLILSSAVCADTSGTALIIDGDTITISGTKVREQLKAGERPDARIMRTETSDVLIEAYRP